MDRALSASDVPLVMWLCGHLHPGNTPSTLPQHILLCLLQQLGASDLLEETVSLGGCPLVAFWFSWRGTTHPFAAATLIG